MPRLRLLSGTRRALLHSGTTAVPIAYMPVVSRGVSAEASDEGFYFADNANDSNYANYWRSINNPPQWLAYDLSTIAAADKTSIVAVWNNSTGDYLSAAVPTGQPRDYTIEGNTGAGGGAAPAAGWTNLVTVTGNALRSREHALNLSTYNWVRLNVSTVNGSVSNTDVVIAQWDLHNAAAGRVDDWLMLGDSITAFGAYYRNPDGSAWTNGPIAVQVNTAVPARFPLVISAGNGGENMQWCYDNRVALLTAFSGHYVAINHGTNDANQSGVMTGPQISSWYTALTNLVDYIASLGMVAVVGSIPWGNANGANQDTNLQALNAKIVQLYTDRPNTLRGPDQYSFFAANHNLIADGLHPTYDHGVPAGLLNGLSGYEWWQQNWRDTMLAIRTGTSSTTPRQISGLTLWLRADAGLYQDSARTTVAVADADPVGAWSDVSGLELHAIQATAGKRPTLKLAIQNGKPVLRYDGVDDLLQAAGVSVTQPDTIFTVCKLSNAATLVFELGGATADQRLYWSNVDAKFHISAGTILTGTSAGQDAWAVKSVLFNGASSQLWNNGASDLTGNAGANALTSLVVGAAGGGTNSLLGDLAEVIIFNRALTTTERRQVEAYLGAKYGITVV